MSLWSRLFGRKPQRLDNSDGEIWRPGDLAVCITDNWLAPHVSDPKLGDVLRVVQVQHAEVNFTDIGYPYVMRGTWLQLKTFRWYASTGFRKAEEDSEPAEEEFTTLIRQPVRPKVTAEGEWR